MGPHTEVKKMAKRRRTNNLLQLTFFLEAPLCETSMLASLEQALSETLLGWRTGAVVARGERMKEVVSLKDGMSLADAVTRASPPRFGLGNAVITGAAKGVQLHLTSCRSTLPPELNYLSIEATGEHLADQNKLSEWAVDLFQRLGSLVPVRYGFSCLSEEYSAKNLVRTRGKVEAISVKLDYSLPGLYWLNFFGIPYVKMIGQERLLSCPAERCLIVDHGVMVQLSAKADQWDTADYSARVEKVIHYLGRDYFFLRTMPDHATRAPDFRKELRTRKSAT